MSRKVTVETQETNVHLILQFNPILQKGTIKMKRIRARNGYSLSESTLLVNPFQDYSPDKDLEEGGISNETSTRK